MHIKNNIKKYEIELLIKKDLNFTVKRNTLAIIYYPWRKTEKFLIEFHFLVILLL